MLDDQLTGSQAELVAEDKADSSFTELFGRIVPTLEMGDTAQCYFLLKCLGSEVAATW